MTELKIDSPQSFPNWIMPWPAFDVDWSKVGLLIIDFQNYGSNPECGVMQMIAERYSDVAEYYVPRICDVAIPNARRLLDLFRKTKREVVYTRHGALLRDGRDMILRRQQRDADSVSQTDRPTLWSRGSSEHQVVTELAPLDDELVIDKNASSPFNGTGIDQLLRNLGLETLVIVGMATDMCVETTARDAADRGYNVIVVEDATATFFPSHHTNALSALARVYAQVWSTEQVIQQLSDVR
jgi:nicotinamidase-related amidase